MSVCENNKTISELTNSFEQDISFENSYLSQSRSSKYSSCSLKSQEIISNKNKKIKELEKRLKEYEKMHSFKDIYESRLIVLKDIDKDKIHEKADQIPFDSEAGRGRSNSINDNLFNFKLKVNLTQQSDNEKPKYENNSNLEHIYSIQETAAETATSLAKDRKEKKKSKKKFPKSILNSKLKPPREEYCKFLEWLIGLGFSLASLITSCMIGP